MSELTHMRQRIKTIETIRKVTHAMRLISMSTHTSLQKNNAFVASYVKHLQSVYHYLIPYAPTWHHPLFHPETKDTGKTLLILVGSQKGLCGTFNNNVCALFSQKLPQFTQEISVVAVGRQAVNYALQIPSLPIHSTHEQFSRKNYKTIARFIFQAITESTAPYSSVVLFSNKSKNFFIQLPHATAILPFSSPHPNPSVALDENKLRWVEQPHELLPLLCQQLLEAIIQEALIGSLTAEQSARFISMDSANRNAQELKDAAQIQYNKLRQTKITNEVAELVTNLSS